MPKKKKTVYIYLLHLRHPLGGDKHKASHYLGASVHPQVRLQEHRDCRADCRFTEAAVVRMIDFDMVRVWESPDGYDSERRLKKMKNHGRYCPVCNSTPLNLRGFKEVNL